MEGSGDEFFGSGLEEDFQRDWEKEARVIKQKGYHQGLSEGNELAVQISFNKGFHETGPNAMKYGAMFSCLFHLDKLANTPTTEQHQHLLRDLGLYLELSQGNGAELETRYNEFIKSFC